jgi:hypothetical protein
MLEQWRTRFRAVGALTAVIAVALVTVAHAASGSERVTAHPTAVMVNTDTTITGSGFPAHMILSLRECGVTFWLAPNDPCNTENARKVEKNARGHFSTPFEAQLCPEGSPARQPTTRVCYIGVLRFGEDTGMLEPAAKVKVSYP